MASHSSTLAWKTPWMEEPGRLQSMGLWRVRHDWLHFHFTSVRHSLACSENKELSEYQRRASQLWTGPSSHLRQRGRWATARAGRQGAISAPEMASSTKLWAGSQLLTKSSWDPVRLTSARRVAAWDQLPRGDTKHTWYGTLVAHWETEWLGPGR